MSVMATTAKMKQPSTTTTTRAATMATTTTSATEFLSGSGADLAGHHQKPLLAGGDNSAADDGDDLDMFLSEITVQFDDEVQTLYVGPVEIVDDDDDDEDDVPGEVLLQAKEELIEEDPVDQTTTTLTSCSAAVVTPESDAVKHDDVTVDLPAVTVDEVMPKSQPPEEESNSQQEQLPSPLPLATLEMLPLPSLPPPPSLSPPAQPVAGDDVLPEEEEEEEEEDGAANEEGEEEPPKGVEQDGDDSANDDRLHRLTAAGVVIDPKNGAAAQPVATEELTAELDLEAQLPSVDPKESDAVTPAVESPTEVVLTQQSEPQPESPGETVVPEPTTIISPSHNCSPDEAEECQPEQAQEEEPVPTTEEAPSTPRCSSPEGSPRKVATEQGPTETVVPEPDQAPEVQPTSTIESQSTPPGSPSRTSPVQNEPETEEPQPEQVQEEQSPAKADATQPTTPRSSPKKSPRIKEEIKQLTPVLPTATPTGEEERSFVNKLEIEPSQLQEVDEELDDEEEGGEEEEQEGPEGELIVPDVLASSGTTYEKDSSPAGSDSGIENEGTDLSKVASPDEEEEEEEEEEGEQQEQQQLTELTTVVVTEETVENIPGEIAVGGTDDGVENSNTQVVILEEIVIQGAVKGNSWGRLIRCAQCAMCFREELWYKKHLMNYHGIDLSNIAHFLSNLQTLDEGIQDGEGATEQEYEEFHLEDGVVQEEEDGGNNDATDKTEEEGESSKRKSEEYIVEGVKRIREEKTPSTPSPATMQMYPEVKMSTSKSKPKAPRRRKEKLVLINSDADMRIKHEYGPAAVQSEESTSGSSQSSQPLMNNMFVVRYLEQAALMVGNSGPAEVVPAVNKENSKFGNSSDPLSFEELDDGMTPFERSKIVETNEEDKTLFTCSICESVFEDRQTVQDHVNIVHKDVKRRSCPHCGRTFNQTGDLTRHVRIHTGIRPFKCPFDGCEYAFISSGDLHKHVRRHNQLLNPVPKPHVCNVCGKDFERGYDLKRHSSMHAKDDPNFQGFSCELCGKMFARKDQYRAHTYRHIGYKPHKCAQCDKTFSDASNYAKHVKVHAMDGVELYCHHCEKGFKNKMAISKHVLRCKYKSATRKSAPKRKKKASSVIKKEEPDPEPEPAPGPEVEPMPEFTPGTENSSPSTS